MPRILDELEQRIAAALQVDGRAPWRKIATVLGEPERTVARRGAELLASGDVAVVGLRTRAASALLRLECMPGTSRAAVEAVAQRKDSTFSYLMTGGADCVAELMVDPPQLGTVLGTEVPSTVGLVRAASYPVLKYFRSIRGWRSGLLTDAQTAALQSELTADPKPMARSETLSAQDLRLVEALVEDGRASLDALARRAGVSETTARRRGEWLLRNNYVSIRAIVEPASVGLPVEAFLWIKCAPGKVEPIGRALGGLPAVRYAAALAGGWQLVADVTVADQEALYRFITEAAWADDADWIETTLLLQARKRGGRLLPSP
ncbi:Lrp/AsnC family transcriptional regulator [Arthrobacter mobilis]|uniref:Lrp/AsnC family transcriptional regulator n=1 Tax=Arthrobacter mobilis TaxID=2724944 RepID=A0A7X6H9T6_9MICC|nr:Lrp/AsnC family transcriptional regulator [Arthrobacter mobilis]NKX53112.1 Lrp/AsnC family transcriptional regulator [Arthrobacter mobilis]